QQCGDNLFWEYADGVLTIIGTGDMYDYADDKTGPAPWYDVRGSITTINMPNEMTKIGDYAFYKCTEVTSINMPTTLTAIGEKAFAQDTKLACEIILPASMTTIASRAFFNCQAVTAFHIEATTPPTIPNDAFERTTAPIHVPCGYGHVYGKHTQWGELNLEMCELLQDNVYYYPIDGHTARAVTYHSNPTDTIVIPSAVVIDGVPRTVTEVADFAFTDCDDLPAIYFSEGLEYIGERAFVRCYGLQGTIVLPATLETIGERAFSYCNNVDRYTIQAMTPPVLGANAFTGDNKNALFYISCKAMDDYKVATNWSSLKSRLRDACLNIYHYNTALGANGVHTTEDTLVANIDYRRKFTTSRWETLYLPFEVDRVTVLEDGVEYDLTAWDIVNGGHYYLAKPYGIENKEVVFAFTQVVDAHTPYIIQFKEQYFHDKMITFHGKESWNKLSTSFEALPISFEMQMAGNTTLQDQILEEPVYMLRATSNFILQNTTTTLHPFECYVMPYATPSGTPARMNVRFRGDVPTALENTDTPSNIGVHKLLRNGQLLILRDGKTYDVIGQKVE
ncbi:MAG: leucine-rich repeat domain-containing protein, partial [Paludibacteraceae bacterium]|nr:leucine-rich repeat domain-containing protein [Paludibacteraceae bacterium]